MPAPNMPRVTPTRIKRLRKRLRISQEDMAAALGVSLSTVQRWESGDNSPSPMAASRILELERNNNVSR